MYLYIESAMNKACEIRYLLTGSITLILEDGAFLSVLSATVTPLEEASATAFVLKARFLLLFGVLVGCAARTITALRVIELLREVVAMRLLQSVVRFSAAMERCVLFIEMRFTKKKMV